MPPFPPRLLVGLVLACWSSQAALAGSVAEIESPMRLSKWLATPALAVQQTDLLQAKRVVEDAYTQALVWMVPEEMPGQQQSKMLLLEQIQSPEFAAEVSRADADELARLVQSFPATGRVVIEHTDPRWLEVNPQSDPWLKPGQRIVIPARPSSVTVVRGNGQTCQVAHSVALFAADYAAQCGLSPQRAWVVQPDGIIRRSGVAAWSAQQQDVPAPGAWIVVDDASTPWPDSVLEQVARMLATQGPAPDVLPVGLSERTERKSAPLPERSWLNSTAPRDKTLTYNDWGMTGLLQTPTARMQTAGNAAVNVTQVLPYTRMTGNLQPTDWFEFAVRWTDIANRLYGPAAFSGNQTMKDKSIDFKLKAWDESAYLPQLAVGLIDLGGTGLFSSEYVVANKRTGDFDWSLGLAWGYLGARGNLGNPLSLLGGNFAVRPAPNVGVGGQANTSSMLKGPTALFGGVQYQTPWENLVLKLEYDGNSYQNEPLNNPQKQSSPVNVGAVYRLNSGLDLALAVERGNTLGVGFSFHGDLSKFTMPKINDPEEEPVTALYPEAEPDWSQVAKRLEEKTSWHVLSLQRSGSEVVVRFQDADAMDWNGYVDRIVSVLHRYVPSKRVMVFRIQADQYGLGMHEFKIDRQAWVEAKTSFIPAHRKQSPVFERPAVNGFDNARSDALLSQAPERFSGMTGVYLDHSFGGPEGFLYKMGVAASGNYYFDQRTWWTGSAQYGLIDNYNKFIYPASLSTLPRVRTQIERYVNSAPVTMPVFQFTHLDKFGSDHFVSAYGGMLESMYGGVGGEWLYRPWGSPLALGVDVNAVKQRGFRQDFSFQPYRVMTGHVSLYWETGIQGIDAKIQAGRYLAGDKGLTLDLSRSFVNGVKMGAYATKTNVSAVQFGEGSFDKGVYVNIPFDAMLTRSNANIASLQWHPLLRDGGAMLNRQYPLYELTRKQRGNVLKTHPWSGERTTQFGDAADEFSRPRPSVFARAQEDLLQTAELTTTPQFWESMLWMSGITLASAALDKPVDKVAVKYGARPAMVKFESVGNMLPFAALGLSGLAFLGDDRDSRLSNTAYTSLAAGGIALASTMGLKYVIGRDRPMVGNGFSSFNFLNAKNANASMPSGHTTIMWAAITPYAKAYDAPWLYGLAGVTNLARIGGRNHWFSDTVAGSMLGYAIGEFMYDAHRNTDRGVQWQLAPNGVSAYWKMD